MRRILVTGAGGFIGSHIFEELLAKGYEVVSLASRDDTRIKETAKHQNASVFEVDLTDLGKVRSIFMDAHAEALIHAAAKLPSGSQVSPSSFILNNTYGTANVLQAADEAGIRKAVYLSSMSVYGATPDRSPISESHPLQPYDHYSLSKAQGEELCRLFASGSGNKATVLRCAGVFGPRRKGGAVHNFIVNALRNAPSRIENDIAWDIVYVKDVARACEASLHSNHDFEIFNMGSGQPTNIVELLKAIYGLVGTDPSFEIAHPNHHSSSFLDISKAREQLGFQPTEIRVALAQTIEWTRTHDT